MDGVSICNIMKLQLLLQRKPQHFPSSQSSPSGKRLTSIQQGVATPCYLNQLSYSHQTKRNPCACFVL